jgi:L-ascorbate metabolism protein UlaG (beta-lactamase superfamily)
MSLLGGARLQWLGHSSVKIVTPAGRTILIDPWLTENPACPEACKQQQACDVILLTHGHGDHLGDVRNLASRFGAQVVSNFEIATWLSSHGVDTAVGMNKGGTLEVAGCAVTMVNAFHSSSIASPEGLIYAGEAAGYVVSIPGAAAIYHAGDTCVFGDMALIGELYSPDLALLPIGNHYTMSPKEAAVAVRLLKVRHVVPIHYGTFPVLTGTPEELARLTAHLDGVVVHALRPGDIMD